jgi:hypothetical protein
MTRRFGDYMPVFMPRDSTAGFPKYWRRIGKVGRQGYFDLKAIENLCAVHDWETAANICRAALDNDSQIRVSSLHFRFYPVKEFRTLLVPQFLHPRGHHGLFGVLTSPFTIM